MSWLLGACTGPLGSSKGCCPVICKPCLAVKALSYLTVKALVVADVTWSVRLQVTQELVLVWVLTLCTAMCHPWYR